MNRLELIRCLQALDHEGIYVFSYKDLKTWFPEESDASFKSSLKRHSQDGLIQHPCRGVYVNFHARSRDSYLLEHIAVVLRKGEYTYLSLESMLSEIGLISQIPQSVLTIMTTGRSQNIHTTYGTIEFTHTKKNIPDILESSYKVEGRPLRLAKKETALRDLNRVNRNRHLLDLEFEDD